MGMNRVDSGLLATLNNTEGLELDNFLLQHHPQQIHLERVILARKNAILPPATKSGINRIEGGT